MKTIYVHSTVKMKCLNRGHKILENQSSDIKTLEITDLRSLIQKITKFVKSLKKDLNFKPANLNLNIKF